MKRLTLLLLVLLSAGVFAAIALADTPPSPGDTSTTTTTATVPTVVPDGVVLEGIPVGGLAPDVAAQAVTAAFDRPVTLRFERTKIEVSPSLLGVSVPVESAVAKALTVPPNTTLTLRATVNTLLIRSFVAKIANRFDRKPVSSQLLLRNSKPFVTDAVIGRTIYQGIAVRDLSDALAHGTRSPIVLSAKLTTPKVTPATIGPVIVIKRGSNQLTLYNGMKVVRTFAVATGQAVYPTPLGKFQIIVKWKNPWWYPPASPWAKGEKPVPPGPGNPLGTRWMGLSSPASASTGRRKTAPSGTPCRTAVSECTFRRRNGCSIMWTSERRST